MNSLKSNITVIIFVLVGIGLLGFLFIMPEAGWWYVPYFVCVMLYAGIGDHLFEKNQRNVENG